MRHWESRPLRCWRLALDALVVLALCSMGAGAVIVLYWVVRLASEIRP